MNERLKYLRKMLGYNQEDLGNKLGVTKTAISKMELGTYQITDSMVKLICTTFFINEDWLRTGNGNMKLELPQEDEYVRAAAMIAKDPGEEIIRDAIIEYWGLNPEGRKIFKDYLYKLAMRTKKEE
jgi:transcriptional regulator with XRE-family HTH domain